MWMELDSHADTTCAGANCIVLEFTQQVVDVTPYNKNKYEPETNILIVKASDCQGCYSLYRLFRKYLYSYPESSIILT